MLMKDKIVIPEAGQTRPLLNKLKVIVFGKTRYKPQGGFPSDWSEEGEKALTARYLRT